MKMTYNTTFMNTVTNPLDIFLGVGTAMGQQYLIGNLMLLAFFMIFLIVGLKYSLLEVVIADSFLTTIIAILLFIAGMVQASIITIPAVIFLITLIIFLLS